MKNRELTKMFLKILSLNFHAIFQSFYLIVIFNFISFLISNVKIPIYKNLGKMSLKKLHQFGCKLKPTSAFGLESLGFKFSKIKNYFSSFTIIQPGNFKNEGVYRICEFVQPLSYRLWCASRHLVSASPIAAKFSNSAES